MVATKEQATQPEYVLEVAAKEILEKHGVPTPKRCFAADAKAALTAFAGLNKPVVVKLVSSALHKSDIGGVKVRISTTEELEKAMREISASAAAANVQVEGFLLEEMAMGDAEILIGGICDPIFGPSIVIGLGGIFTEIMKDFATRICPITREDAMSMLHELKGAPLLFGARGRGPLDVEALIDIAMAIGGENGLLCDPSMRIKEMDINPVIVGKKGAVAVDARFILQKESLSTPARDAAPVDFGPLFKPRAAAFIGASASKPNRVNDIIDICRNLGFSGGMYPIHPSAETINGLRAYKSVADCPEDIDYAFLAIPAAKVPEVVAGFNGKVRFVQIMSSGFAETSDGIELNRQLLAAAKASHVRIIGPNCLGTYSPGGGLSYMNGCPKECGPVAVISQSGGLSIDMLRRGTQRGIRYRCVVSMGNSADLTPTDFLDYLVNDPETKVIGFYLESLRDGRRFFETLKKLQGRKPVVILKGGRSKLGQKAASSHTGAMAGDDRLWTALAEQTGAILVSSIDAFLDALLTFQCIKPKPSPWGGTILLGNGGGASVLASDVMESLHLPLEVISQETMAELQKLPIAAGTSLVNPIDLPAGALKQEDGLLARDLIAALAQHQKPKAIIYHINMPQFLTNASVSQNVFDNLVRSAIDARAMCGDTHLLLVLRSDGSQLVDDRRRPAVAMAMEAGVPVYREIADALAALAHIRTCETFLSPNN